MSQVTYDLVIVGAGIVGAWSSFLASVRFPDWRVLVVDASMVASGATRYSAGLAVPYARNAEQRTLVTESESLMREYEAPAGLPRTNVPLRFVAREASSPWLAERMAGAKLREACSSDVASLRAAYPDLRIARDEIVFTTTADAWVGQASVHALSLVEASGATTWECTRVSRIEADSGGQPNIVTMDGRTVEAGVSIVAVGPWTGGLCGWLPAHKKPQIKRVVAWHADVNPIAGAPIVMFPEDDVFFLPQPNQRRHLVSFNRDAWPEEVDSSSLTLDDRDAAESAVRKRSQRFAACLAGGLAFCDGYTADLVPFIERHPSGARLVAVGGGAGSAFRLAPAMAARAIDALTGGAA